MEDDQVEGKQSALAREVAARKADWERKRTVFYPRLFKLIALGVVLLIAYDYWMFHSRIGHVQKIVTECGGRPYSIGGWPIGQDNMFVFDQELTGEQIERMKGLNDMKYRTSFRMHYTFHKEEEALKELIEKLGIYVTCDE